MYLIVFLPGNRSHSIGENVKKIEKLSENESNNQDAKNLENTKSNRVRGLINPFDKSQFLVKLTSNRRRWSHTFPESKKKCYTFYSFFNRSFPFVIRAFNNS